MKYLIFSVLLSLHGQVMSSDIDNLAEREILIIGTFDAFEIFDHEHKAILKQAIHNAGFGVEFVSYPETRSLSYANSGAIDGDVYRSTVVTKQYENLLAVPDVIKKTEYFSIIKATNHCLSIKALKQVKPVGVLGVNYFEEVYALSEVGYEQGNSVEQVLEMLLRGRAGYSVAPDHSVDKIIAMSQNQLKACSELSLISRYSFTYLHKKHADKIPLIAAELKKLRE